LQSGCVRSSVSKFRASLVAEKECNVANGPPYPLGKARCRKV